MYVRILLLNRLNYSFQTWSQARKYSRECIDKFWWHSNDYFLSNYIFSAGKLEFPNRSQHFRNRLSERNLNAILQNGMKSHFCSNLANISRTESYIPIVAKVI